MQLWIGSVASETAGIVGIQVHVHHWGEPQNLRQSMSIFFAFLPNDSDGNVLMETFNSYPM